MKRGLFAAVAAAGLATLANVAVTPFSSAQVPEKTPGITISVGGSAVISTKSMPPGGEIWAEWYSLPAGQAVDEPATGAKWAFIEMALDGSGAVTAGPAPNCNSISAGGHQASISDRTADAGDIDACDYAVLPGSHRENRGSQAYIFASLSVGGPSNDAADDTADRYLKVKGVAKAASVASAQFGAVEKELLKAGAMKLSIRNVTVPAGGQLILNDHYPTLRMVENGQLSVTSNPDNSATATTKVLGALEFMEWIPANANEQVVLSNKGDKPVQFVEWAVSPVDRGTP